MDSNEQLAERVKSGNSDVLELWWRVRRFAYGQAIRWVAALGVQSGVTIDDLLQSAFLAFLDALERWEPGKYTFLAVYGNRLKLAFTEACGLRTSRTRHDPLRQAMSLDAPADPGNEDSGDMGELVPDPAAAAAFEDVEHRDRAQRLHNALERAMRQLPADQRAVIRAKYWQGKTVDGKTHSAALRALRHPAVSRELKIFL